MNRSTFETACGEMGESLLGRPHATRKTALYPIEYVGIISLSTPAPQMTSGLCAHRHNIVKYGSR